MTAVWSVSAKTGLKRLKTSTRHTQLTLTIRMTRICPFASFFIISPTDQQVHCWSWIKKHMPNDPHLHLEDVSWKYTGMDRHNC